MENLCSRTRSYHVTEKRIFELCKSPIYFDELISKEQFGQIALKSDKSTYRFNSIEDVEFALKQKSMFSALKHFQSFRTSFKFFLTRSWDCVKHGYGRADADGGWRTADGGRRTAGGWRMADGGWQMADGARKKKRK